MLKNISRLESIVEGKVGHFFVENDAPLHAVKEMLFQFQKYVGHVEDAVKSQQAQMAAEQSAVEPVPSEPQSVEQAV